jgi:hypothetical protein
LFNTFRYNLGKVHRLIESHEALTGTTRGKKGSDLIKISAVLMLCAAGEMYVEHIAREAADHLTDRIHVSDKLPLPVQKELAKVGRDSQHELKSSRTLTQTQLR